MPPPTADRDPAAKVAFVSGAAANAGGVSGLHARLLLFPAYKALVDLLHRLGITGRRVVIAIPYLWLLAFFLAPFLIVLKISFARSEEHTSELQSLMRISYAVFCLKKKTIK